MCYRLTNWRYFSDFSTSAFSDKNLPTISAIFFFFHLVPGPVPAGSLLVEGANQTAIAITWEEPHQINGKLEKYEVIFVAASNS